MNKEEYKNDILKKYVHYYNLRPKGNSKKNKTNSNKFKDFNNENENVFCHFNEKTKVTAEIKKALKTMVEMKFGKSKEEFRTNRDYINEMLKDINSCILQSLKNVSHSEIIDFRALKNFLSNGNPLRINFQIYSLYSTDDIIENFSELLPLSNFKINLLSSKRSSNVAKQFKNQLLFWNKGLKITSHTLSSKFSFNALLDNKESILFIISDRALNKCKDYYKKYHSLTQKEKDKFSHATLHIFTEDLINSEFDPREDNLDICEEYWKKRGLDSDIYKSYRIKFKHCGEGVDFKFIKNQKYVLNHYLKKLNLDKQQIVKKDKDGDKFDNARTNNLPVQLTKFIGREVEMKLVKDLLKETHLLTFAGFGGIGKTRLVLQVATDFVNTFA
ncbi:MAG: hypothetical protein ABI840_13255, partial [bacterium]